MPAWFYRILLLAYPREFRRRWGNDLQLFWSAQSMEPRYRTGLGPLRLCARLLVDSFYGGLRARMSRSTSRPEASAEPRHSGPEGPAAPPHRYSPTPPGTTVMHALAQDLRYALRSVRRSPLFAVVVVATLALGIGATAAVFSVVDSVLLRPLPFPRAEELVLIPRTVEEGKTQAHSWPDFRDYREQAQGFLGLSAYCEAEATFAWDGGAESLRGASVTREFFDVMGIPPLMGRTFSEEEERMGGPRAVILSHRFWQTQLGGDPSVLDRTLPMDGAAVPVVGVMPEGFSFPFPDTWFWTAVREDELLAAVGLPTGTRTLNFLQVVGRVDPSVGTESAEARLRSMAESIDEAAGKPEDLYTDMRLVPLRDSLVGDTDRTLFLLLASAGLVLLVACANVAGLSFSRATVRRRELAVRAALGAGRRRILAQLLTESLVLSLAGGIAGVILALGVRRSLLALAPEGIRDLTGVEFSPLFALFVGGITVFSGFAFGFIPAFQAARAKLADGLAGGRGTDGGRHSLRPHRWLVTAQVALSVVLLVGATFLVTSLSRLTSVDRGFQSESVILATVAPSTDRYDSPAAVDAFYASLLEQVRALPGVSAASTTYSPPLTGNDFWTTVLPEGVDPESAEPFTASVVIVRDGYFDANGIDLLQGRDFGPQDRLGDPLVAIVSHTFAETLWPGEDPMGKRFARGRGLRGSAENFDPAFFPGGLYTVVGVADDVRRIGLAHAPEPEYYRPHSQLTWAFQYLVVRTTGDPSQVSGDLRQVVWGLDPTVPVKTVETLSSRVRTSLAADRFRAILLAGFAGVTAFLAMVGLYALMALLVARRAREMGIRMALGAESRAILRGILARGLGLVAVGLALGLVTAFGAGRVLSGMLFQVEPSDPGIYLVVAALVTAVALAACFLPARRASRLDPVRTLQEE